MVRLLNSEILLGSKRLNSVSPMGTGKSPRVGDTLPRLRGDEIFGLCGRTPGVDDDNVRVRGKEILRGRNHFVGRGRKWALGHLRHNGGSP